MTILKVHSYLMNEMNWQVCQNFALPKITLTGMHNCTHVQLY